jgi:hypothetical protein
MAWSHLQYAIGYARLGYDVYFLEDSDDYPSCYDPIRDVTDTDPTYGLAFASEAFRRVGLADRWAFYDAHTLRWHGPCGDRIVDLCERADLLLNLSNVNPMRPWFESIPARALVDTDPTFTQIRHLTDPAAHARAERHTAFLSLGENVGTPRASIPDDGFHWQPTRQPVVLEMWPQTPGPENGKFTTVMIWQPHYPASEYAGRRYGMKSETFGPYIDLPEQTGSTFEMAIGGPGVPRTLLTSKGWTLRDPREPTRTPWTYQEYLQGSKAEFTVAKQGYVVTRSGWFSERSAAYLASGRPVLTQETGFSDWIPTGAGLLSFNSPEEARAGIAEINRRYLFHCRAARELAEAYFDSNKILPTLVEQALYPSPQQAPG